MMGKRPFRSFEFWLSVGFLALVASGCASSRAPSAAGGQPLPSLPGDPDAPSTPPHTEKPPLVAAPVDLSRLRAELSSTESSDAGIVLLTIRAPEGMTGLEAPGALVGEYDGSELPFFADPEQGKGVYGAVVGVAYGHKSGPSVVKIRSGEKSIELPLRVIEGKYDSETLQVARDKVRPTGKKVLARIKREASEIGAVYRQITRKKYWKGPFVLPIDSAVTSHFGTKRIYNGIHQNSHLGLDLKAGIGTPIHAPAAGIVAYAKNTYFLGNMAIIDHGYGVMTVYGHMSQLKVKPGDVVEARQLLGLAGKTGRVTGPHLHWMAVIHRTKVNPSELTRVMR